MDCSFVCFRCGTSNVEGCGSEDGRSQADCLFLFPMAHEVSYNEDMFRIALCFSDKCLAPMSR